ncbi:SusC/RagA family TonB-linked outer membrane protein [Flavobacterium piscis]|uniref:SusC/RagA family TonB-linked outer membrane protein n=1 Tax=Flavobacterium piscis TaxID=1114874 RepID=A0ABX2XP39_9FLAO|nr:TonB-dependent receptor [Flavobacterium piscis]OCB76737.1 SusC/RagA family TonB-linked outer membrane protein [Flavobacterium piscis]OXG06424.1 SusC/RagA family TonB-linked outer membrane protein [Flavobacterium piscis]
MILKFRIAIITLLIIGSQNLIAQSKTVQGIITDPSGFPLPGASVNVEGSKNSASTDFDGKYSLSDVNPTDKITYSFVGLISQTITVGTRTRIDVVLALSTQNLNEVIVGYGSQKRTKVTGAISTVSSKDIVAVPITNAESALQGRAAGVTVVNGAPGSNPTVTIRGLATMGNSAPLYVIDGVLTGNLSGLSPNDIESMSVLKDASTTALYGSKAFNGVIMVTTKKGKKGPGQLNFSTYAGFQTITKRYDVLNTQQYLQYAKDLGSDLTARAAEFGNINTNWQDQIFQSGVMQDYNLSFSNGTETSTSRYSAEYLKQEGAVINTGFERYSFRANNTQDIGKLKVGSNIGISFSTINPERSAGGRTLLEHAIKMAPYLPIYNNSETSVGGYQGPSAIDGNDAENPVRVANLGYQKINNLSIIGNIYAELEIFKGLKFRSQVSLDYYTGKDHTFVPSYSDGSAHNQAFSTTNETNTQGQTIVFDNSLTYKTTIAAKHNIEVLGVITKIDGKSQNLIAGSRYNISNDIDQLRYNEGNLSSANYVEKNIGYIARINYDYDDKYIFAASGRRDASSRFGANNRWGNFYSFALGWNIAKESFMANSVFSTLKLRASTGTTGNDRIDNYQYAATLLADYNYPINGGNAQGVSSGVASNPDLKWESKKDRNIGLDFGFFDEKFTGSVEYFNNKSSDILFAVPLAASVGSAGGGTQLQNVADVKVSGYEISLGYNDRKGDFTWSALANLGTSKNEVTGLAPGLTSVLGGPSARAGLENFSRLEVGQPLFYFYGYETNGIYQNQAEVDAVFGPGQTIIKPGDIRIIDRDGNKIINSNDKTNIGNPYPDFTYGLNLTAAYKKFDFNCFITGVQGNDIYNANTFDLTGMNRLFNASTDVLGRANVVNGVVTNPSATLPRAQGADINWSSANQRYIEDGSYTRLKNVTLGYTLSGETFGSYFSNIRFYVSGQNLITITKYSGLDPEIARTDGNANSAGIDLGRYPQPKSVIFGLDVKF